jgi:hypothetical protein
MHAVTGLDELFLQGVRHVNGGMRWRQAQGSWTEEDAELAHDKEAVLACFELWSMGENLFAF